MSTPMPQIGPIRRAWYRWKMLRLPWRKRFLVGLDLQGNTYWIFRDLRDPSAAVVRWRRIVRYPSSAHPSDVRVPPQWHQWLRYVRDEPPSLTDQAADVARQARIKVLAAEADARWEARPRLTDDIPSKKTAPAALDTGRPPPQEQAARREAADEDNTAAAAGGGRSAPDVANGAGTKTATTPEPEPQHDPWKRASGPSETWQPEAWTPTSAKRR